MSIETQKVIWKNIDGQTTEVDKVKIDSLLAGGGGEIEVDLHYDGTSEHAQSGKAVAEAIESLEIPEVDDKYSSDSHNAQSGIAVAEAIGTIEVPTVTNEYSAESAEAISGQGVAKAIEGLDIPTVTDTYSPESVDAISGKGVAEALGTIDIPTVTVDQSYSSTSEHAQSGKAVAEAIAQGGGGGGGGGFSDIEEGQLPVLDGVIWSKHSNAKTAVMGIAGIVRGYENSVFYSLHTPSPVVGEFDKGEKVSFSYSNTAAYPHDYLVTTKALVDYVSENGSSGGGGGGQTYSSGQVVGNWVDGVKITGAECPMIINTVIAQSTAGVDSYKSDFKDVYDGFANDWKTILPSNCITYSYKLSGSSLTPLATAWSKFDEYNYSRQIITSAALRGVLGNLLTYGVPTTGAGNLPENEGGRDYAQASHRVNTGAMGISGITRGYSEHTGFYSGSSRWYSLPGWIPPDGDWPDKNGWGYTQGVSNGSTIAADSLVTVRALEEYVSAHGGSGGGGEGLPSNSNKKLVGFWKPDGTLLQGGTPLVAGSIIGAVGFAGRSTTPGESWNDNWAYILPSYVRAYSYKISNGNYVLDGGRTFSSYSDDWDNNTTNPVPYSQQLITSAALRGILGHLLGYAVPTVAAVQGLPNQNVEPDSGNGRFNEAAMGIAGIARKYSGGDFYSATSYAWSFPGWVPTGSSDWGSYAAWHVYDNNGGVKDALVTVRALMDYVDSKGGGGSAGTFDTVMGCWNKDQLTDLTASTTDLAVQQFFTSAGLSSGYYYTTDAHWSCADIFDNTYYFRSGDYKSVTTYKAKADNWYSRSLLSINGFADIIGNVLTQNTITCSNRSGIRPLEVGASYPVLAVSAIANKYSNGEWYSIHCNYSGDRTKTVFGFGKLPVPDNTYDFEDEKFDIDTDYALVTVRALKDYVSSVSPASIALEETQKFSDGDVEVIHQLSANPKLMEALKKLAAQDGA